MREGEREWESGDESEGEWKWESGSIRIHKYKSMYLYRALV